MGSVREKADRRMGSVREKEEKRKGSAREWQGVRSGREEVRKYKRERASEREKE
jgi:hypothetical protein